MVYQANMLITPENILQRVSQEEIMHRYLGVDSYNGTFCSPLRKDRHPTCTLTWINGKYLFRDWATDRSLDCFGVVMEKFNVNYPKAQEIIASDFDLIKKPVKREYKDITFTENCQQKKEKSQILIKAQPFSKHCVEYLQSYHITGDICKKYNVYCPEYVWLNGSIFYKQDPDNPALAYYFGKDDKGNQKWKIYFYKAPRYSSKFISNTNRINGWVQLPEQDDLLVITKSLKDVMVLDLFGISSIAMQAETQSPYDYIVDELKERFKRIVSLFDHDQTGIERSNVLYDMYDIPYFFIKDDNAKDISDYIKYYGFNQTKNFLNSNL